MEKQYRAIHCLCQIVIKSDDVMMAILADGPIVSGNPPQGAGHESFTAMPPIRLGSTSSGIGYCLSTPGRGECSTSTMLNGLSTNLPSTLTTSGSSIRFLRHQGMPRGRYKIRRSDFWAPRIRRNAFGFIWTIALVYCNPMAPQAGSSAESILSSVPGRRARCQSQRWSPGGIARSVHRGGMPRASCH